MLARRGAARPEQIYALAALAPVQATLGMPTTAAATLRTARVALRESPSPGMFVHLLDDAERRLRGKAARRVRARRSTSSPPREMSVLRLLGSELSIAEIGDQLYISRNTVKTHVRGIYRKLDAETRAAAVDAGAGAAPALSPVHRRAHQRPERPGEVGAVEPLADRAVEDRRVDRQQAHRDAGEQRDPPARR